MKRVAVWIGIMLAAGSLLLTACSTTRVLAENEARLAENKVVIVDGQRKGDPYNGGSLQPYIKQKATSSFLGIVNPLVYIYNWQNGRGGWWDRLCQKVGVPPVIYDPGLLDDSSRSMEDHLEYEGWYNSRVEPRPSIKKKRAKVKYDVTLGKRFPIRDISFQIRDTALAGLLAADSARYTIHPGDPLSEVSLEKESERVAQHFRNNGYWGFSKNYFFFYADTSTVRDSADLIVAIENYTRNENEDAARPHRKYHIGNVALVPAPGMKVRQGFLHNLNQLEPGQPYSEQTINRTYDRFASIPMFSSVNMLLRQSETDTAGVDCRILLQQARLQAVKANLEGSFNSTGLFGIAPSLSYSHKNVFGGGEMLTLGFRGNFQFMLHDPIRANEFAVSTGLRIPWYPAFVWKMSRINLPQMDINFSYSHQDRPEYNRDIVTGTYGFSWNINKHYYYQVYPIQLSAVRTSHIDEDFYSSLTDPYLRNSFRSHLDLGAGAMFYYTTNTTVNPKVSYFYTRLQLDVSGNMASLLSRAMKEHDPTHPDQPVFGIPYSQYVRGEVQAVETIRLGAEDQYALAIRGLAGLGYAYGNSISLPFEKLFYAGGAGSLRGWRARAVGPGMAPRDTSFKIVNQSGDMRLEANLEFRFPIVSSLQGAIFLDAGNVWNIGGSDVNGQSRDPRGLFSFRDLARSTAVSTGLGARLDFGLILVRFDLGLQLYDPSEQEFMGINDWVRGKSAFHFGIGYPF